MNKIGATIGIEETFVKDDYTYFKIGGKSKRCIKFDNVYIKWMRRLYSLVVHIGEERDKRSIDINKMNLEPKYQFFGLAESVADQLIYFFVKDVLSDSNNNQELDSLCYHMYFTENNNSSYNNTVVDEIGYMQLKEYLVRLVTLEFNSFTGGQFYDFYVSYWSCFETCLNYICEPYEEKIREKLNTSQFNEMKKFLGRLYKDVPDYEGIIEKLEHEKEKFNKKFGRYVSFPDKYSYLFKEVLGSNYTREEKKDRVFLEFCGAMRNTVHNNGMHLKSSKDIIVREKKFTLEKGKKQFSDDYSDVFILAEELFDIYVAILDGLETPKSFEE